MTVMNIFLEVVFKETFSSLLCLHIHVNSTNSLTVEGFMLSNALVVTDG